MCRVAFLRNVDHAVAMELAQLQANGANRPASLWTSENLIFLHSRFDVTTDAFPDTAFPLRDDRYVVHFNGEVFGFKEEAFVDQPTYPSDVHYCLALINQHGVGAFLRDADIQGTFQIYDKHLKITYIVADQINSAGCFYAHYDDIFIAAQEVALVNWTLSRLGAECDVPIKSLSKGHYLKIDQAGTFKTIEYRPHARQVFSGSPPSRVRFERIAYALQSSLKEAVIRRLPQNGPVVVLASGGVDSGVILTMVAQHLKSINQLDRLKVAIFGRIDLPNSDENDLINGLHLMEALQLSPEQHLIHINEDLDSREDTLLRHVFSDHPRLITPNPILNSQVRHTVRMSLVLSELVQQCPEVKVVLTGDVADELFAGYPSMHRGVTTGSELAAHVREKLSDLTLNDSARYTLASLYGCSSLLRISNLDSSDAIYSSTTPRSAAARVHPVEVRTPFSSHRVLQVLRDAHADFLVGSFGGKIMSKFLLRVVAQRCGVPIKNAGRRKISFNEGGSGIHNADRDPLEEKTARSWGRFSEHDLLALADRDRDTLIQLCLITPSANAEDIKQAGLEQLATYAAAKLCGLDRLLRGGAFRARMPDSVYATEETESAYQPAEMLHLELSTGRLEVTRVLELDQTYV